MPPELLMMPKMRQIQGGKLRHGAVSELGPGPAARPWGGREG